MSECAICLEYVGPETALSVCGSDKHFFHPSCVIKLLKPSCPCCRNLFVPKVTKMWCLDDAKFEALCADFREYIRIVNTITEEQANELLASVMNFSSFDYSTFLTVMQRWSVSNQPECVQFQSKLLHIHTVNQLRNQREITSYDLDYLIERSWFNAYVPIVRTIDCASALPLTDSYTLGLAYIQDADELLAYLCKERKIVADSLTFAVLLEYFVLHGCCSRVDEQDFESVIDGISDLVEHYGLIPGAFEIRLMYTVIVYCLSKASCDEEEEDEGMSDEEFHKYEESRRCNKLIEPLIRGLEFLLTFGGFVPVAATDEMDAVAGDAYSFRTFYAYNPLVCNDQGTIKSFRDLMHSSQRFVSLQDILQADGLYGVEGSDDEKDVRLRDIDIGLLPAGRLQGEFVKKMNHCTNVTFATAKQVMPALLKESNYWMYWMYQTVKMMDRHAMVTETMCGEAIEHFLSWLNKFAFAPPESRDVKNVYVGLKKWFCNLQWILSKVTMCKAALCSVESMLYHVQVMVAKMIQVCTETQYMNPYFYNTNCVKELYKTYDTMYTIATSSR